MSFSAAKVRSCSDSARGGSPGRRTVRAQLSWWSWGKFRVLRRGQAKSAGLSPAAAWSGGPGPGPRGQGGGARAGGREWAASERPRLCGHLLPLRPPFLCIVCSGAAARGPGPQPNVWGAPAPGVGGAAAPQRRGCPLRHSRAPARPGPAMFGFPGRLLRGPGTSAARWVSLVRPSPRTSAGDAREQLSRADADDKHAKPRLLPGARPGTYAGRRRAARGDPLRDGTKCKPYFETKEKKE